MDVGLPVYRQHLTRSVICTKHVKPVLFLVAKVGRLQNRHNGVQVWEDGKSERRAVMARIGVATSPPGKPGRLPSGVGARERTANWR